MPQRLRGREKEGGSPLLGYRGNRSASSSKGARRSAAPSLFSSSLLTEKQLLCLPTTAPRRGSERRAGSPQSNPSALSGARREALVRASSPRPESPCSLDMDPALRRTRGEDGECQPQEEEEEVDPRIQVRAAGGLQSSARAHAPSLGGGAAACPAKGDGEGGCGAAGCLFLGRGGRV